MRQSHFELEIESRVENLPIIAEFVRNALEQFGVDPASEYKIELAVDEACTNVIKHAYAGTTGPIKLALEVTADELVIVITNKGKPFDPSSVPPPDLTADVGTRKIGGLGMYFMNRLMDEVAYRFDARQGNQLTMKKRLSLRADAG